MSGRTLDTRAALAVFIYVTLTLFGWPSHAIRLTAKVLKAVHNPEGFLLPVCPLPRSLATTNGISFDVLFLALLRCFSSGGSPPVPMDSVQDTRV